MQGTTHINGLEAAVLRNIEACKNLSTIVRTSMGPNGKKKMVINHLGKLFVTSDSSTIIQVSRWKEGLQWQSNRFW